MAAQQVQDDLMGPGWFMFFQVDYFASGQIKPTGRSYASTISEDDKDEDDIAIALSLLIDC